MLMKEEKNINQTNQFVSLLVLSDAHAGLFHRYSKNYLTVYFAQCFKGRTTMSADLYVLPLCFILF